MSAASRSGAVARGRERQPSVLLTPRDVEALKWVGEQFAVRVDQLPRVLAQDGREVSRRTCRGVLERWTSADFVVRRKVFVNEPGWVWLTRHGSNAAALDFKLWVPKFGNLSHVYWVNEVRLRTAQRHPDVLWVCERSIRKEQARHLHVPDAEVVASNGQRVAVEVELTQKSAARAAAIARELASRYPTIWFFFEGRVGRSIERAINELPGGDQEKFKLYPLEAVR
jgi:hypothetical protein